MKLPERLRQAKILIADDHEHNVVLLTRILQRGGFTRLTGITDPRQIQERVKELEPDLLLLDLHMPHLDGLTVMKQLQSVVPAGLPMVLVTGEVDDETRREAISCGASDVLTKPYELDRVLEMVERLLCKWLAEA
jgi:putative two-component system response regulator